MAGGRGGPGSLLPARSRDDDDVLHSAGLKPDRPRMAIFAAGICSYDTGAWGGLYRAILFFFFGRQGGMRILDASRRLCCGGTFSSRTSRPDARSMKTYLIVPGDFVKTVRMDRLTTRWRGMLQEQTEPRTESGRWVQRRSGES